MKRTGDKHLLNALGHIALASVCLAPVVFVPWPMLGAPLSALLMFGFREWEQYSENKNLRWRDRSLDILEGVLGAFLLGLGAYFFD